MRIPGARLFINLKLREIGLVKKMSRFEMRSDSGFSFTPLAMFHVKHYPKNAKAKK